MRGATHALVGADSGPRYAVARALFDEYAAGLRVDLGFQGFEAEKAVLPDMYGPPSGHLVLVMDGDSPVGCGAVRAFSGSVCEMKRLYLREVARGHGLGRHVAEHLIERAVDMGYRTMRLDTLAVMSAARHLYRALGFHEIEPYYANPIPDSIYMEMSLVTSRCEPPCTDPDKPSRTLAAISKDRSRA